MKGPVLHVITSNLDTQGQEADRMAEGTLVRQPVLCRIHAVKRQKAENVFEDCRNAAG